MKKLYIEKPSNNSSEPNSTERNVFATHSGSSNTPTCSTPTQENLSAELTKAEGGTKTPEEARPPPSPCQSDPEIDSDNISPDIIFIDMAKSAPERLVALESIEPELLDESQIGRILLAMEVRYLFSHYPYLTAILL